ncbi:hypothetical protein N825_14070 [Skermanella stibiiresistens SB22]|uniref:Nucleotidyltransferase-like domain-containing protein n=1 Tax=Skermanella stibiiresistens SB22 TaxID=1385369 RepID=W9H0G0_9PROT|nr:GSU2403 family nucleotidyltransferase fold protein [Skermanella stibiiresistens]EWY38331.1 hypothetical protein N825_14070 [Skermanella stibiiresistens SB22]
MRELDLTVSTIYTQLLQQGMDAEFETDFPENGTFGIRTIKGRQYWYYNGYDKAIGKKYQKYVGPSDPELDGRVERFKSLKSDFMGRRQLVAALRGAGVTGPDPFVAEVVNVLRKAGLFRLRCVLVGTVAYQCYGPMLGVILRPEMTKDADFAQYHSVSVGIGDDEAMTPLGEGLRVLDPTFQGVADRNDPTKIIAFANKDGFRVEFLTPNRSKDEYQDRAAGMPPLGSDRSAQPPRYLDYLIHDPVRAILLHGAGIPVTVPRPERYAVHKLIVATQRRSADDYGAKRDKDISQAAELIEVMRVKRRHLDLAEAWIEAWERGPSWRDALRKGKATLPDRARETLAGCMSIAGREMGIGGERFGFS